MLGKFKFMAAFSKEKMDQAADALTAAVVKFDPETATDAAIALMDEQVDQLSLELAKANQALVKERDEADSAKENFNKKISAAQALQSKIDEASGAKAKSLQGSLDSLLEDIDTTRADVELEIQEAEDAQAVVDAIQETLNLAVSKLKTARSDHKRAQSELKRAEMAEKRAEATADRNARLAGVAKGSDGMSVALDALRDAASDANAKAEAMENKAKLLKPFDSSEDANIAAVMAELDGEDTSATSSEKVASLKGF